MGDLSALPVPFVGLAVEMGTADIEMTIKSLPAKKEDLRKAFEELESQSSFFASFTMQWKDINGYFTSIEKSIDKRFQELNARGGPEKPTAANIEVDQYKPAIEPRPELKSFCVKMHAKGLRLYIIGHRNNIEAVRRELGPALLCSPDPVTLVLDSFEGFVRSSETTEGENQAMRRAYLTILECFHELKLEVNPSDKERARRVATECHDLITNGNKDAVVVMVFLYLIATFGLLGYFAIDDILDLIVTVAKKKNIVDLCRNSALEEKIPDLIDKLNKKGKQLDSVKFVLSFNLQHMFPPAYLLNAYIKESEKDLHKGNYSAQLTHESISKQIACIKEVMEAVEEYNLGSQYPLESLQNHIQQLEKQRPVNRRAALPFSKDQKQQDQPFAKRPRPSDSSATVLLPPPHPHSHIRPQPVPSNSAPTVPSSHPQTQNQPQLGLADQSPYMGFASSHDLITAPSIIRPPKKSHVYPLVDSAYYDRPPVRHGGYANSNSGFPHDLSPYP